jgi:hypothetical protein
LPDTAPRLDSTQVPEGAAFGQVTAGGVTLSVVAKTQGVVDDVLASAKTYPGADYYGCEAEVAVPALGAMAARAEYDESAPVSLCRYEAGVEGANLIDSEVVVAPADLESFALGISSAEPGTGPDSGPSRCTGWDESQALLVRSAGQDVAWVHYDGCTGHGLDLGGTTYRLNAQLTYWALPRGGFGVDGSIPLPKEMRH